MKLALYLALSGCAALGAWAQASSQVSELPVPAHIAGSEDRNDPFQRSKRALHKLIQDQLRARGITDADLPAGNDIDFSAVPPVDANFQLERADWDFVAHSWQFRMRCPQRECLPFLVQLRVETPAATRTSGRRGISRVAQTPVQRGQPSAPGAVRQPAATETAVRSGTPSMLLFEKNQLRMRIPVICLQRGTAGQKIRVRTVDGHRILPAQVVDQQTVTAVF